MKADPFLVRAALTCLATFCFLKLASADQFCDEVQRAVQEGKKEFVHIKGSKTPDSDAVVTDFRSTLQIKELQSELGCELEADSDRVAKLSFQCRSDSSQDEAQIRAQFNDLARQLTQCIQTQFPEARGPDRSSRTGDEILTFTNLAETGDGWQLKAALRLNKFENRRHPELIKYSVALTIGPA